MANKNLPPQAYTREILADAYNWLRSQSPSTKELARDVNTLVSLYLQAKRHNKIKRMNSSDAIDFKKDLKNLAEGIKKFEEEKPSSQFVSNNFYENNTTINAQTQIKQDMAQSIASSSISSQPPIEASKNVYENPFTDLNQALADQEVIESLPLTPPLSSRDSEDSPSFPPTENQRRAQEVVSKTRELLNLSSDEEARNALITIGFEQIKSMFNLQK